jgi:hypothetical protein
VRVGSRKKHEEHQPKRQTPIGPRTLTGLVGQLRNNVNCFSRYFPLAELLGDMPIKLKLSQAYLTFVELIAFLETHDWMVIEARDFN